MTPKQLPQNLARRYTKRGTVSAIRKLLIVWGSIPVVLRTPGQEDVIHIISSMTELEILVRTLNLVVGKNGATIEPPTLQQMYELGTERELNITEQAC